MYTTVYLFICVNNVNIKYDTIFFQQFFCYAVRVSCGTSSSYLILYS